MEVPARRRFVDSVWLGSPGDESHVALENQAEERVRSLFAVNNRKSRGIFPLFPPLAAICAALIYKGVGLTVTMAWCAVYLAYLLARQVSQRRDLERLGVIPWQHAIASASANAAMFGALVPIAFDSLSFSTRLQLSAILMMTVSYLSVARYNMPSVTRLYHVLIVGPLALAWVIKTPNYWSMGAFLVVMAVTASVFARGMRNAVMDRTRLELANEALTARLASQVMQLELMNKSKTEQLISACHDLRQPAHAMGLAIEAVLAESPEGEQKEHIRNLQRSNTGLSDMLTSLMDLARLDSGAMQAHSADVPLRTVLDDVRQHFSMVARHKGLFLKIAPCDLVVLSDVYLLRRILFNLVSNAIRYTNEGGVTVSVLRQLGRVVVTVSDTGIGIAPEYHARVFDEYTRIDPSGEGLGIGLSVVRRGCKLLNHTLSMESGSGGTTVSVGCELSTTWLSTFGEADVHEAGGVSAEVPALRRGLLVAVLEDDLESLRATMRLIGLWGFDVLGAERFDLLLRQIESGGRNPDMLVTDLHLGLEDGVSAALALRARPGLGALPVLLVTGDLEAQTIARAGNLGFPLMHKPVSGRLLKEAIEQATSAVRPATYPPAAAPSG